MLKAKNTEFGKEYGFSSIKTYTDFKNQIPIRNYEELFPYIRKLKMGEEDVLWPGKTRWFSNTKRVSKYCIEGERGFISNHRAGENYIESLKNQLEGLGWI